MWGSVSAATARRPQVTTASVPRTPASPSQVAARATRQARAEGSTTRPRPAAPPPAGGADTWRGPAPASPRAPGRAARDRVRQGRRRRERHRQARGRPAPAEMRRPGRDDGGKAVGAEAGQGRLSLHGAGRRDPSEAGRSRPDAPPIRSGTSSEARGIVRCSGPEAGCRTAACFTGPAPSARDPSAGRTGATGSSCPAGSAPARRACSPGPPRPAARCRRAAPTAAPPWRRWRGRWPC